VTASSPVGKLPGVIAAHGAAASPLAPSAPNPFADASNAGSLLPERASSIPAILAFFAFAFIWSWGIAYLAGHAKALYPVLSASLMMASGFGPSLSAVAVVAFLSGRAGLRNWLARALNLREGRQWLWLAFFAPPLVMLLALALHAAFGGAIPTSPAIGHIPLAIANFGLVFLIGGPLGEEFGWRGFALPALGPKMGWRAASLVIGIIWGLWHLPLFFTAGIAQFHMSVTMFMINIIAGSVLFSWLSMRSAGSAIPALVAHTSLNAWAGIL
jgi:uncharacterized protein